MKAHLVFYLLSVTFAFLAGGYFFQDTSKKSIDREDHDSVRDNVAAFKNTIILDSLRNEGSNFNPLAAGTATPSSNRLIPQNESMGQKLNRSWSMVEMHERLEPQPLIDNETDGDNLDDVLQERIEAFIDQLDIHQIETAISSMTGMAATEISEIDDLYDYAGRLVRLAVKGVISEESNSMDPQEVSAIEFTQDVVDYYNGVEERVVFNSSTGRIYAVFQTDHYDRSSVVMKWYQIDSPHEVLFKTKPILQMAPYNYVWAEYDYWPEGKYKVEIYSTGNELEKLAAGEYEISVAENFVNDDYTQ